MERILKKIFENRFPLLIVAITAIGLIIVLSFSGGTGPLPPIPTPTPTGTPGPASGCGDVNGDGIINYLDSGCLEMWRTTCYKSSQDCTPHDLVGSGCSATSWSSDVNCDGKLDLMDVMTLHDYISGKGTVNCCAR